MVGVIELCIDTVVKLSYHVPFISDFVIGSELRIQPILLRFLFTTLSQVWHFTFTGIIAIWVFERDNRPITNNIVEEYGIVGKVGRGFVILAH